MNMRFGLNKMNNWNQDKFIYAWNYASEAHNGQLVPGTILPYINHIGLVAMEAMAAVAQDNTIESPDLLIQCALLHDTIEDTHRTYDDILRAFGKDVADGVLALSKDTTIASKNEQMKDSIKRIKDQPKEIWMVKLSDRISNLQQPPTHWNKEKIIRYRNEALMIFEALGIANGYLSSRLRAKISGYEQYLC